MTIVEETRAITGGVDTHAEAHVAAALDPIGGLLGTSGVPRDRGRLRPPAELAREVRGRWLAGIEGTGSYGAGLARYIAASGIRVVEVDRADRQDRRRKGKSDLLTELRGEVPQVSGQIASWVATFAGHGHGRGSAAGSVAAGGAFARVA